MTALRKEFSLVIMLFGRVFKSPLADSGYSLQFAGEVLRFHYDLTPSAEPWLSGECHAQFQFARVCKTHNLTSPESAIHILHSALAKFLSA